MNQNTRPELVHDFYLEGGGEMGRLTRSFDWASTMLGKPDTWSQSLLTTVSILLNSRFPMFLFWGQELIQFYNDGYRPSLGNTGKHPAALGQRGEDCWQEIWPTIKPLIDQVLADGEATWSEDQLIPIYRNSQLENVYWTFSYSQVKDETGKPAGVLVICQETTKQVESRRHIQSLNEELAAANEELAGTNEELAAGNEELSALNEELLHTQNSLLLSNSRLTESEERFRVMAEGSDVLIGVSDENNNAVYLNKAWEKLTGRLIKDLLNLGWVDLVHPEDKERFLTTYLAASAKKISFTGEFRMLSKAGDYRWLLAQCPPRFRADGSFAGYISSCIDITERKQDEQRKNDFIGMVSHELKTPLTSLSGYLQMLQLKTKSSADTFITGILDKARNQAKRMTSMINGFLNVSRLESGKIQIDKQRFLLDELIQEMIAETTIIQPTHSIALLPCEPLTVNGDRDKIGSVLSNLLSNAVKYSPYNKAIEVRCKLKGDAVQVSIRDEGIGIKPENIDMLFERYYRIETDRKIAGFGIGLYLSAEIIHRHGGKIWAESEEGKGSIFFFTLPLQ